MSSPSDGNNPYYHKSGNQRRPGIGRYSISQDESSHASQQMQEQQHQQQRYHHQPYLAPSLVAPTLPARSTGLISNVGPGIPDDEYLTPNHSLGCSTGNDSSNGFVTEPPRNRRALTGKISTLFRREASQDRAIASRTETDTAATAGIRRKKPMKGTDDVYSPPAPQPRGRTRTRQGASHSAGASNDADDDDTDNLSTGNSSHGSTRSRSSASSQGSKRIFYSNVDDDDDESSFETGASSKNNGRCNDFGESVLSSMASTQTSVTNEGKIVVRYRGFSTSIKSLFLDETVVCASMGCFGLVLSGRTEYLLNLRNERRGTVKRHQNIERKKVPSRIVAYGLLVTLFLMFITFAVWGTGSGGLAASNKNHKYYDPNNNYASDNNNNNQENDDYYAYYTDDTVQQQQGDDYVQQQDQQQQEGDDGNLQNDNNDDNVQQQQYNQYNQNNYDNQQQDENGNDNGNVNNDNDGDEPQNDYDNEQQDENDNGDFYAYNDNGGNRRMTKNTTKSVQLDNLVVHSVNGIFKLRDYKENLWDPIYEFLHDEWYRGDVPKSKNDEAKKSLAHHRRTEDNGNYGYSNYQYDEESGDNDSDSPYADVARNIRVALFLAFLLFLGVLGRRRRMRTRFYLVRARAQEDHLYYASVQVGDTKRIVYDNPREDQYEGACSHTLCGWYPADEFEEERETVESIEVTDDGIFKSNKKKHHNEDIVARGFNCLMACCCGFFCKCWFQCLSICALAQEAREIRLLVPPRYQRIDFITHQPFHEYQKDVNDLRRGWLGKARKKSGIMPHLSALSRLSRYILVLFITATIAIGCILLFNPRSGFYWPDAVVLGATFLQAFAVIFIVHWIFHKSDLSLDAVIKMFASGFLIAVPSAFFFEALLANTFLLLTWSVYEIAVAVGGDPAYVWITANWRVIWMVCEVFNAYFITAVTEELCKYYTFRTIEHPDLVFLTGLTRDKQDESAHQGGIVKYPFASHQVQKLNRAESFGNLSQYSSQSTRSNRSRSNSRSRRKSLKLIERTGTMDEEFDEDEADVRTYRQKAMAITTAMISVAVGLACAENCIYVFVLGGASQMDASFTDTENRRNAVLEEWLILLFRSIFPIHALSAALQSINMIRKFVETDGDNGHRIGVGRIILPAVLLHGTFDAVLMYISSYEEAAWEKYLQEHNGNVDAEVGRPYNPVIVNVIAWVGISLVTLAGVLWYYRENRKQRDRLKVLEVQDKAIRAQFGGVGLSWDQGTADDEDDPSIV